MSHPWVFYFFCRLLSLDSRSGEILNRCCFVRISPWPDAGPPIQNEIGFGERRKELKMSILAWIVLGLIAGFIGSKIVNKQGEGLILDMIRGSLARS
jgi:hypothetical protein